MIVLTFVPFGHRRAAAPAPLKVRRRAVRRRADRGAGDGVDRAGAPARARRHDDRGRTGRVPRDADAQELRPAGQQRAARRDPSLARRGVRTARRDCRRWACSDAALDGFRIVGDAATPLGTGVLAVGFGAVDLARRDHRCHQSRASMSAGARGCASSPPTSRQPGIGAGRPRRRDRHGLPQRVRAQRAPPARARRP